MDDLIDGTDGKLGYGLGIDIIPGDRPRPTYISAKFDPEYKQ